MSSVDSQRCIGLALMPDKTDPSPSSSSGLTIAEAAALDIAHDIWETWDLCGDGKRRPTAEWLAKATSAVLDRRKGPLGVSQLRRLTRKLGR